MNLQECLSAIPHRPPFRFVDEVVELGDGRILATLLADPAADYFAGHFPGNPVMPGVLICEAVFQAGAILMLQRLGAETAGGKVPLLTRIGEAKFKHIVRPGDHLGIEVVLDDLLGEACYMTGRVTVDAQLVLRVSFVCMLVAEDPR
ncbi:MAG: beta-hydroxyacyl-ACP dehydratase [bacterium]|nr:beta-hydroxyacyl-ACP dehydratase [bacterium]